MKYLLHVSSERVKKKKKRVTCGRVDLTKKVTRAVYRKQTY